jgi:hypothetical protein
MVQTMKTLREKELEEAYAALEIEYTQLKDRYDQLCGKLRDNANDKRNNEGDNFLRSYARNWK